MWRHQATATDARALTMRKRLVTTIVDGRHDVSSLSLFGKGAIFLNEYMDMETVREKTVCRLTETYLNDSASQIVIRNGPDIYT